MFLNIDKIDHQHCHVVDQNKLQNFYKMNEVASNSSEKCLKNYLYDNPELSETKTKKACAELDEDFDSDTEVWILQCPKNYDPQQMMNIDLGKVEKQSKMECSVERFGNKKTLAVIVAAKSEYELVRDNIKLVRIKKMSLSLVLSISS